MLIFTTLISISSVFISLQFEDTVINLEGTSFEQTIFEQITLRSYLLSNGIFFGAFSVFWLASLDYFIPRNDHPTQLHKSLIILILLGCFWIGSLVWGFIFGAILLQVNHELLCVGDVHTVVTLVMVICNGIFVVSLVVEAGLFFRRYQRRPIDLNEI